MIETREANFLQFLPSLGGLLNGSYGIFSAWLRQDIYTLVRNFIHSIILWFHYQCHHVIGLKR